MFSGPIEDRLGIRERFDSYSDAVTRQALDDYLDCWTDDGARFGAGGDCQGIEALRQHWHGIWKMLSQMGFMTQIGSIVIDGADGDDALVLLGDLAISRRHDPSAHRDL